VSTRSNVSFKLPGGPSAKVRRWVYALIWIPTLVLLLFVVPQFTPIFNKLEKTGDLPEFTAWMMAFARMNNRAFFLPVLAIVLGLLILDARVVVLLGQSQWADALVRSWFIAVCCLSFAVLALVVYAVVSPLFLWTVCY
jgi:hypothetical protein